MKKKKRYPYLGIIATSSKTLIPAWGVLVFHHEKAKRAVLHSPSDQFCRRQQQASRWHSWLQVGRSGKSNENTVSSLLLLSLFDNHHRFHCRLGTVCTLYSPVAGPRPWASSGSVLEVVEHLLLSQDTVQRITSVRFCSEFAVHVASTSDMQDLCSLRLASPLTRFTLRPYKTS